MITAAQIMTSPAVTIAPEASVEAIVRVLSDRHISALPVCKPDGTLVGLVSEGDILRPFRESARLRRDWWLSMVAEGEALSQQFLDYLRQDTRTAAELMVRHVVTADEHATLPQLAELMSRHGVKRIPILRGSSVVGIVSRSDMIAALARTPALLV
ncbi:CBS domain-containing protein [Acidisphaera rubrifaciens]|uniref:Signal transduction protein with CBS n=1 Tax=Acidisphaera rubrifaciens HS-AP3 TaxID=1231350 RepID=A0A0D6P8Q5_9PROT|nr:CBS domain-containing protein [Acidisphaera rubrifaciens]GAN77234.1 signal transduction protein with CBS [Acidisphaera rubrifaciens HS-AP3]